MTGAEQQALARWSGWGAVPALFDDTRAEYADERAELHTLLSADEFAPARRSTLNAHYTDAALVHPIWEFLTRAGVTGGRVLEPGCGSGHFLGFAPAVDLVGVEWEPTTAAIARALYPDATVLTASFADVRHGEDQFDAVVGNVPFSRVKLHDPEHNPQRLSMHNHFILKSVRMTRPGGLIALISSRYTLDAQDPTARQAIAEHADLVTAVRLPTAAHRRAAGTDVVTDLIVLRRRDPDTEPAGPAWLNTATAEIGAEVNEFFLAHPEHVLGDLAVEHGRFDEAQLQVRNGPADLGHALSEILGRAASISITPPPEPVTRAPLELTVGHPQHNRFEGTLAANDDGTFSCWIAEQWHEHPVPTTQAAELRSLVELRDTAQALLRAETASTEDNDTIIALRATLNTQYEDYVRTYGPASRYTWSSETKPAWQVFTQWSTEADLARLPAKPSTVLDYLQFLADGGCARHRVEKHLRAITDRHTKRSHPLRLPQERLDAILAACPATEERPPELGDIALQREKRKVPPQGGFRADPFAAVVYALEDFDSVTGAAARADIFTERVMRPVTPATTAATPAEAISLCLDRHGELRLDTVAELLGAPDTDAARERLGDAVFDDPASGELVARNDYLSGNVREKLHLARGAADTDPRYRINVTALHAVQPRDLGPAEIEVQLGSWIGPTYVQDFLRELLHDDLVRVEAPGAGVWNVIGGYRSSPAAREIWGTRHRSAHDLTESALTGSPIRITYKDPDGNIVEDRQATAAARQKADEIKNRFRSWVWEDTQRAAELVETYNTTFNSEIPRSYDDIELSMPGLSSEYVLRPHQKTAIAAQIFNPAFGLFHEVGAGKTLEMICGAMECRRLGFTHRQVVVVPNHMLEQFHAEWLRAYPQANLIAASSEDLQGPKRQRWVTRAATGNWDAIIMTRGAFQAISVSPEAEEAYFADVILRDIEEAHAAAVNDGCDESTVKELEELALNAHERIAARLAGLNRDPGLTWEELGVDKVIVDEAQDFANALRTSGLPDLGHHGSDRALDLDIKLHGLATTHGRPRVVLATATPWRNSLGEIYTVLRRFGQITLPLDAWARTFAELITTHEMVPGGGFKEKTRMRSLVNVPELMRILRLCADIRVAEDLNLPTPTVRTRTVEVTAVPELMDYNDELGYRYATLPRRPEKGADNHLSLLEKGVAAALDVREVGLTPTGPQKVDELADMIAQVWEDTRDAIYRAPGGAEHPTPGGLQLVFCSRSTPKSTWNFYDELRQQLTRRGMPASGVRYIHDAKTEQQKAQLFRDCNTGAVSVLIGSAEKMGTGVNVQTRALGLYRVTPGWRPDIPHQERGRVERQGNQNNEVFDTTFVTTPSLDAKRWEVIRQKWDAFRPLMTGRVTGRTIDVDTADGDHYAELMAAASGDRRVVERAALDTELRRLQGLRETWNRQQTELRYRVEVMSTEVPRITAETDAIEQAITTRRPTRGEQFTMRIDTTTYPERADAARALNALLRRHLTGLDKHETRTIDIGTLGGHHVQAELAPADPKETIRLSFQDIPGAIGLHHHKLPEHHGLITRLENYLAGLEQLRDDRTARIAEIRASGEEAHSRIGAPFPQAAELDDAKIRLDQLNEELLRPQTEQTPAAEADTITEDADPVAEPPPDTEHPVAKHAVPENTDTEARMPAESEPPRGEAPERPVDAPQPTTEPSPPPEDAGIAAGAPDASTPRPAERSTEPVSDTNIDTAPPLEPACGIGEEGPWSTRVRITVRDSTAEVTGTDRDDPPELRSALNNNGFRWKRREQLWRYEPHRDSAPSLHDAIDAVRSALSTLDRQEREREGRAEHAPTPPQATAEPNAAERNDTTEPAPGADSPPQADRDTAHPPAEPDETATSASPVTRDADELSTTDEPDTDTPAAAIHGFAIIDGITDEHPIDPGAWQWHLDGTEPVEIGVIDLWRRGTWRLALAIDDDGHLICEVNAWDDDNPNEQWAERIVHTREELETILADAGRHALARPAHAPDTWAIDATWTATDADDRASTTPAGRHAYLDPAGQWLLADTGEAITTVAPAPRLSLPDRAAVLRHVHGPDATEEIRTRAAIVLSGKSRKNLTPQAAARDLADTDREVYARAITAASGRTGSKTPFDTPRATQALQRLADADPTLPALAAGTYVDIPSDRNKFITGLVRGVEFAPPNRAVLVMDTNAGDTLRSIVDADAVLTVSAPPTMPADSIVEAPEAAIVQQANDVTAEEQESDNTPRLPRITAISDVHRVQTDIDHEGYRTRHEIWQGVAWSTLTIDHDAAADAAHARHRDAVASAQATYARYRAVAEAHGDAAGAELFPDHPGAEQPAHPEFVTPFPLRLTEADTTRADVLRGRLTERRDTLPATLEGQSTTPIHLALTTALTALTENSAPRTEDVAWHLAGHDRYPLHTAQRLHQLATCLRAAHAPPAAPPYLTNLIDTVTIIATRLDTITRDPLALASARADVIVAHLDPETIRAARRDTDRRRTVAPGTVANIALPTQLIDVIPPPALHLLHHTLLAPATGTWPPRRVTTTIAELAGRQREQVAALVHALATRIHDRSGHDDAFARALNDRYPSSLAERLHTIADTLNNPHGTTITPPPNTASARRRSAPAEPHRAGHDDGQLDLWSRTTEPDKPAPAEPRSWDDLVSAAESLGYTIVLDEAATQPSADHALSTITIPWPADPTIRCQQLADQLDSLRAHPPAEDTPAAGPAEPTAEAPRPDPEPVATPSAPSAEQPAPPATDDAPTLHDASARSPFTEVPLEDEDLALYADYLQSTQDTEEPDATETTGASTDDAHHGEPDALADMLTQRWHDLRTRAAQLNITAPPQPPTADNLGESLDLLLSLAERVGHATRPPSTPSPAQPVAAEQINPAADSTANWPRFAGVLDIPTTRPEPSAPHRFHGTLTPRPIPVRRGTPPLPQHRNPAPPRSDGDRPGKHRAGPHRPAFTPPTTNPLASPHRARHRAHPPQPAHHRTR